MPKLIYDLAVVGTEPIISREETDRLLPQRFEMRQIEEILHFDREARVVVGSKTVREDEFWARGHIPGRPLFPGVLMIETAAQLCTVYFHLSNTTDSPRFIGMGAVDAVRFRAVVVPGQRLLFIARCRSIRSRAAQFDAQAVVDERIVFEASITGVQV